MSKLIALSLAAGLLLASGLGAAASEKTAVEATVREMIAKANAGKDVSYLLDENCSIIDEFGPFAWSKSKDWMAAYRTYAAQNGESDAKTQITGFRHVNVAHDRAYVVIGVVFSFKKDGKTHRKPGLEVMTLRHVDPSWAIDSFAWFGRDGVDSGADATAIAATVQDFASLKGAPSPDPQAIVDEFSPFAWTGKSASVDWYGALQKLLAAGHATGIALATSAPSELQINGNDAYAAFPTVITTKAPGKTMRETGSFAFAFHKDSGAWHIASWAWATN